MSAKKAVATTNRAVLIAKTVGLGGALALSAYLMCVAMRPPSVWWLGLVTLLPLLLAIRVLSPVCALVAGSFWGACFFGLSQIGGSPLFAPTLPSFVLLAAIPGLYAGLGAAVTRRVGFSPLLLALGWVGVEFALHPLALHNGLLAGALGDGLVVRLVGTVAGYVLVAFLVAFVAASLLSVIGHVCTTTSSSRVIRAGGSPTSKLHTHVFPLDLLHNIRSWRPRGPPAAALAR